MKILRAFILITVSFLSIYALNGYARPSVINQTLASGKKLKVVFLEGEFAVHRTIVIDETICRAQGEWAQLLSGELVGVVSGQIVQLMENSIKMLVNDRTYILKYGKKTKFCDANSAASKEMLKPGMTITATAKCNINFEMDELISVQNGYMRFVLTFTDNAESHKADQPLVSSPSIHTREN